MGLGGGAASGDGGGGGGGKGTAGLASSDTGGRGGGAANFAGSGFAQYNWQSQGGSGGTNWNNASNPVTYDNGSHEYFGGIGGGGGGYCSTYGYDSGGAMDGIANRGQGGGGEGDCPCRRGSYGGSGIVQVRYAGGTQASGGNYTYTSGGYTIHVFLSSGTFTPSC
jgi:hypothetical protein